MISAVIILASSGEGVLTIIYLFTYPLYFKSIVTLNNLIIFSLFFNNFLPDKIFQIINLLTLTKFTFDENQLAG